VLILLQILFEEVGKGGETMAKREKYDFVFIRRCSSLQ